MPDQDAAIESFTQSVNNFPALYEKEWLKLFGAKLGLNDPSHDDVAFINELLDLMAADGSDFTNTFANLHLAVAQDQFTNRAAFADWHKRWKTRGPDFDVMARANPQIIPRNHQIEAVIQAGVAGDFAPFHTMLAVVTRPYQSDEFFANAPADDEAVKRTFCGT
jgi:uncharacterized protein YdiU (UPF0061 family)